MLCRLAKMLCKGSCLLTPGEHTQHSWLLCARRCAPGISVACLRSCSSLYHSRTAVSEQCSCCYIKLAQYVTMLKLLQTGWCDVLRLHSCRCCICMVDKLLRPSWHGHLPCACIRVHCHMWQ